jgi:hypothetical protein
MYQLKGFIGIKDLVDNTVGAVSPFGELSLWSQTYTKDRGEYENPDIPGFRLSSIYSLDTSIGKVTLATNLANRVLVFSKWVYDYFLLQEQPISRTVFSTDALSVFGVELADFNFGEFITNNDITLPEWLTWKNLNFPDNEIKIWFSDNSFSEQFEETEIVTIPPVVNIDDFFISPVVLKSRIEQRTFSETMDLIQLAKNKNPETIIRTEMYNYTNAMYPGLVFPTNWSILIYGKAGDNPDTIKEEIITYILANSTHSRDEWTAILPDLFKRTEFMIMPVWYRYAIPNKTVQAGLYSPVIKPLIDSSITKAILRDYDSIHVDTHISYLNNHYKSLALTCVASIDNRNATFQLTDYFPDYINVNTSSLDFNRMNVNTQNWALLLEEMIIVAESMTYFSTIPNKMRRVVRNGFVFISTNYQNVQYLVSAKMNLKLLNNYINEGYVVPDLIINQFNFE